MWAVGAVSRNSYVNQLRIYLLKSLATKAVFLGRTGEKILPKDIRVLHQLIHDLPPFIGLQIKG